MTVCTIAIVIRLRRDEGGAESDRLSDWEPWLQCYRERDWTNERTNDSNDSSRRTDWRKLIHSNKSWNPLIPIMRATVTSSEAVASCYVQRGMWLGNWIGQRCVYFLPWCEPHQRLFGSEPRLPLRLGLGPAVWSATELVFCGKSGFPIDFVPPVWLAWKGNLKIADVIECVNKLGFCTGSKHRNGWHKN